MSLILDALKRAEGERASQEGGTALPDILSQAQGSNSNRNSKILMLVIFCLLVALVGLLWILIAQKNSESSAISQDSVDEKVVAVSSVTIASEAVFQPDNLETVSALYQQTSSSVLPSVEQVEIAALYQASSSLGNSESAPSAESTSVENPLPDPKGQLPAALQPSIEVRRLANEENIRLFENLSLQQKQHIPSMNYSQHNYLGNSASSVVINGELMRVGARIGRDLVIREILEDGIVLDLAGVRIGVRALSSWINM